MWETVRLDIKSDTFDLKANTRRRKKNEYGKSKFISCMLEKQRGISKKAAEIFAETEDNTNICDNTRKFSVYT